MNAAQLMRRIAQYGGDMAGIQDRFMGNEELYESCLTDFIQMSEFALLDEAMRKGAYERAFTAAHAIKGVAGNLGVTRFYRATCELVEILRAKNYAKAEDGYAAFERALGELLDAINDEGSPPAVASAPDAQAPDATDEPAPPPGSAAHARKARADRFIVYTVAAVAVVALAVCVLFGGLIQRYRDNATMESAVHLSEITQQIRLYTEAHIEKDWVTAYSVANSVLSNELDDKALLEFIRRERAIRGVTDITLYMENGYAVNADGSVEPNGESSDIIVTTREQGAYMSIMDSNITYAIAVETQKKYNGSRIMVVSIHHDLDSFLDDMSFSAFDNKAYLYLTQEDGVLISMLSHPDAPFAYNVLQLLRSYHVRPLLSGQVDEEALLRSDASVACAVDTPRGAEYVIAMPISTRLTRLRLFFIAPQSVVNLTTNNFSDYITMLSVAAIVTFALAAAALFVMVYLNRKRSFDTELKARDRMFDLLVLYSQTAFGLYSTEKCEPMFLSSNARKIIGDQPLSLERDGDGFRLRGTTREETEALRQINQSMAKWNGRDMFRSGFVRNVASPVPSYFELQVFPVADDLSLFVVMAQDTTQAYEQDAALREALRMARQASEAKSHFLSNTSHDIRTPMNAIINMTRFARENLHDPRKAGDFLDLVETSAHDLLQLVNDVLDMSRIESGLMIVDSKPFDLRDELTRVANVIRPLCMERQQYLVTDFSGIRVDAVLGDARKLTQVLTNLLSNAVKFTPRHGAVRFVAQTLDTLRDDWTSVRFTVEDTGIGIAKELIADIFEPFMRVDEQRVSHIEGTGLGLSICKSYVTVMGGTIRCESELNEGSVFIVELAFQKGDYTPDEEEPHSRTDETPFLGLHCLMCEDMPTNQVIAHTMLERTGMIVEIANDGKEGLNRFLRSGPGDFDLIYMDIQMPQMDGYQTTIAIRESSHPQARTIPIIAMTANVFAEDIEKARIAGMDGHLGKPLSMLAIIEETNKAIRKKQEGRV